MVQCKYCLCLINSKKSTLISHAKSKKHQLACEPFSKGKQKVLNLKNQTVLQKARKAEARTALYIAQHTSINVVDHLHAQYHVNFTDSCIAENIQLHRTKTTAIINNVWFPFMKNELIKDIGDGSYSLIIDESTDISIIKYLGIIIKYYSKKTKSIVTTYLKLADIVECNALALVECILSTLEDFNLNIKKMSGLGTDNASVMVGINNGVITKLQELNPNIILVPCVCHSLQLAVSSAAKEFLPRNLEYLVSETYNWFSNSTIRRDAYLHVYKAINDGHSPLKIVQSCATRWLSIESAVKRIYEQWEELKAHFQIARTIDKCYKAEQLYFHYQDDASFVFIVFLLPILGEVQRVNKAFESNTADCTKLMNDLCFLIESFVYKICFKRTNFDPFVSNIENNLIPNPTFGFEFENKLKESLIGAEYKQGIRTRCIDFLKKLIMELRQRLPKNIEVLRKITMFSIENTLKTIKPSLVKILEASNVHAQKITKIEHQWQNIQLVEWNEKTNSTNFWVEVLNYKNACDENPFIELGEFVLSFLTLPISNAEVERLFSQMNIIKTKQRNRLAIKSLNSIMCIRASLRRESKCCHNYEIPDEVIAVIGTVKTYETETDGGTVHDDDEECVSDTLNFLY